MKIDVYAVGACKNNGQPTQIAGCGVVLAAIDEYGRESFRSYGYGLGGSTQNLADLQAARLALASVRSAYRDQIILHTSDYVARLLKREGSSYVVKPSKNVEVVEELRRWASFYGDVTVNTQNNGDYYALAKAKAEEALQSQLHTDSGTQLDREKIR